METRREYRFRIEPYTPETMPLGRLAEYLTYLARLLGYDESIHLVDLEEGSTTLVYKIENEAIPKIEERATAVRLGQAPKEAMAAYVHLNGMLRHDNGSGSFLEDTGAEILFFPGRKDDAPVYAAIEEYGTIDGEVVRVGGVGDTVPITLLTDHGPLAGCHAKRPLAKQLANLLFEPVRLHGNGRWTRQRNGRWVLNRLLVDRFERLSEEPLSTVVLRLQGMPGLEWGKDGVQELIDMRHGNGEPNGGV